MSVDTVKDMEVRKLTEVRLSKSDDQVTISGYAAVFDQEAKIWDFREVIRPGAFKRSLTENDAIRLLINHDGLPIANTKSNTLTLREDTHGLKFEARLDPADPDVQSIVPKLERGDVDGMSFGFVTREDSWDHENGIRTLIDVDLLEVSVVGFPAYDGTDVAKRSRDTSKEEANAAAKARLDAYWAEKEAKMRK